MAAYGTDEAFEAWLAAQGLSLPVGANLTQLRTVGSAYIDAAYEPQLSCSRRAGGFEQELAWPRHGHRMNGEHVPDALIPQAWINASYRAAYLQATQSGWATNSSDPNRIVKRQKVDVIEREFFEGGDGSAAAGVAVDSLINAMVLPWLCSKTRSFDSLFRVI